MRHTSRRVHRDQGNQRQSIGALIGTVLILLVMVTGVGTISKTAAAPRPHWTLVWHDEFNGPQGARPSARWTPQVGGSGWGNQEDEYYTNSPRNAHLDGHGHLAIVAYRQSVPGASCWYGPCAYTSARLITQHSFSQKYGRFEARIKVPAGLGYWPAFWLLGTTIDRVGWPACGEIDIMENVGQQPSTIHGSLHGPGTQGSGDLTMPYTLQPGQVFADAYHVFAVDWAPRSLSFSVDGHVYGTVHRSDLLEGTPWVYDHPFFLLLNVAIGGTWPGDPAPSTRFPQAMLVDYVRVYKQVPATL